MGQAAVIGMHLGYRQLPPVGVEDLAPALELALPAVVFAEAGGRLEEQLAEVFQGRQLGQAATLDLAGAVQGDGGKTRIDVFHQSVAVDQDKGAGALLDGALEQVRFAAGAVLLMLLFCRAWRGRA
ncbi:hypothetical protein D9M68_807740 [compost metagenome]